MIKDGKCDSCPDVDDVNMDDSFEDFNFSLYIQTEDDLVSCKTFKSQVTMIVRTVRCNFLLFQVPLGYEKEPSSSLDKLTGKTAIVDADSEQGGGLKTVRLQLCDD